MSVIDTLIYDRTQADVDRWEELEAIEWKDKTDDEKEEWKAGPKGSYSAARDMNRVGEAMTYLATRFRTYGYSVPISPKTDWVEEDIPTEADLEHYLEDLRTLRGIVAVLATTPQVPEDMEGLTHEEANDIERMLFELNEVIERILKSFRRSGQFTFWSGYLPLPAAESDMGRTWAELDAMQTTWRNWQVADWYLLLYGNLKAEGDVTDGSADAGN